MTTNEIAERKIYLDFTPASLELTNYEEFKEEVEKYAQRYDNLEFTRDEKQGANKARTELLALEKAIEDERKKVKAIYNEPLAEFEQKIKVLTDRIKQPLDAIRQGLKEIDEAEKNERAEALMKYVTPLVEAEGLTVEDIYIDPKWTLKGNWTDKMNPSEKLQDEVAHSIAEAVKERQRMETELRVLVSFCETIGVEPEGYIGQLEFKPAVEIIEYINFERAKKAKIEAEVALSRANKAIENEELETAPFKTTPIEAPIYKIAFEVSGTAYQLKAINNFIIDVGAVAKKLGR